jgi:hypothetical protein
LAEDEVFIFTREEKILCLRGWEVYHKARQLLLFTVF